MRRWVELAAWLWLGSAQSAATQDLRFDRPPMPSFIDPVLAFATYLGGGDLDHALDVAVDAGGGMVVAGFSYSSDFPLTAPWQGARAGGFDAVVARFSPSGDRLIHATYLGGSGDDFGLRVAVDAAGFAWIAGNTLSADFETTPGALQPASRGDLDGFVARLDAAGTLRYATYLGGSSEDVLTGIAVDGAGNAYLTGMTRSLDFPLAGALDGSLGGSRDAFVVKLDPTGGVLLYATYLGGTRDDHGMAIAVTAGGEALVTGWTRSRDFPLSAPLDPSFEFPDYQDAFVTRLDAAGAGYVFSTYLGGAGGEETGLAIAAGGGAATGDVYVAGQTNSDDFPVASAAQARRAGDDDAFVSRLTASGDGLIFSTYLGGSRGEVAQDLATSPDGSVVVVGSTESADFPTVAAIQGVYQGGAFDAFVARLDAGGALTMSSFLGGSDDDLGLGAAAPVDGLAIGCGSTWSGDLPLAGALQPGLAGAADGFVVAIDDGGSCRPPAAVGNSLRAVVDRSKRLVFRCDDTSGATGYDLWSDGAKGGPYPDHRGAAASGAAGIELPLPAEPRLHFRIAASNACGSGPK